MNKSSFLIGITLSALLLTGLILAGLIRLSLPMDLYLAGGGVYEWDSAATISAALKTTIAQQLTNANLPYQLNYPSDHHLQLMTVALDNDQVNTVTSLLVGATKFPLTPATRNVAAASVGPDWWWRLIVTLGGTAAILILDGQIRRGHWRFGLYTALVAAHNLLILLGVLLIGQRWGAQFSELTVLSWLTIMLLTIVSCELVQTRWQQWQFRLVAEELTTVPIRTVLQVIAPIMQLGLLVLCPAIILWLWGGEGVRWVSIWLAAGAIINMYSSIAIVVALLMSEQRTTEQNL